MNASTLMSDTAFFIREGVNSGVALTRLLPAIIVQTNDAIVRDSSSRGGRTAVERMVKTPAIIVFLEVAEPSPKVLSVPERHEIPLPEEGGCANLNASVKLPARRRRQEL